MPQQLTPVPGATPRYDDDGREIIEIATCGHCGRSWNDAAVSSITPAPSGRCPFEYEHESRDHEHCAEIGHCWQNREPCPALTSGTFTLSIELGNDAMTDPLDVANALREVAGRIEGAFNLTRGDDGFVRDENGNTVGRWAVS